MSKIDLVKIWELACKSDKYEKNILDVIAQVGSHGIMTIKIKDKMLKLIPNRDGTDGHLKFGCIIKQCLDDYDLYYYEYEHLRSLFWADYDKIIKEDEEFLKKEFDL